jgi:thiamine pyrophosphokinase
LNTLELIVEHDVVTILHGPRTLRFDPTPGTTVSLIPVAGSTLGVSTTGLKWNLTDESLSAHAARGLSNIAVGAVQLSLIGGVLAVIVPANVERNTEEAQP